MRTRKTGVGPQDRSELTQTIDPEGGAAVRRLVMWNLLTLDGYFEGSKSWELDWHDEIWGEELERFSLDQLHSAEMLVFGRVTYEGMAAYWPTAEGKVADLMNSLPKVVFSRTLKSVDWANTTLISDAVPAVLRLKEQGAGDMFVFGSADLSTTLIREGLFDEYRLLITPVILGNGRPLFGRGSNRQGLKLLESRPLASGAVILRYAPR
jgi:dihydrofolate reductase